MWHKGDMPASYSSSLVILSSQEKWSRSCMRTELVVALITESDALNTRTFLCHAVPTLELMDIFLTDFYLRGYKCTYKSNSWKTFETLWSGLSSWLVLQSQLHTFTFIRRISAIKGGIYLMWVERVIKCGIMGMASTDCRKFGKQNMERSCFSNTPPRKEAPR